MNKRVTIEDVARIAGVSTATVSRAINTPEVVSDSTRNAVNGAITKTGFTLNLAARNLRQQRANAIVVLVPDIGNTFFSEILAGIERVASAADQTILIGHTATDPLREEKYLARLVNGQADGALLLNGHLPGAVADRIRHSPDLKFPIVSVSEALDDQIVPHVGIDNVQAAALGTQYLLDKGHRDIVHLQGPRENILTRQRAEGFSQAMQAAGLEAGADCFLNGDFTIESGIAAAQELGKQPVKPTAVFCANDEMAIGLMSGLTAMDIAVPKDISVMGFDDIAFAQTSNPGLTTIRQPRAELGERAMTRLLGLINNDGADAPMVEVLVTRLIERESVANC